ncbi:MAG: ABC transporter ATP-binding protein [Flavobacteriales bacterium]
MKNLKRILAYIKPYKSLAILNIVGNVLAVVFGLFTFLILGKVIGVLFEITEKNTNALAPQADFLETWKYNLDQFLNDLILAGDKNDTLLYVSILLILSFLFKNVFRYAAQYVLAPLRSGVLRDIRMALHRKIMKLPISYFSEKSKGDLITRTTADVIEIEWSVISILELLIRDPFTILSTIGLMVVISWKLTLFVFIFLPLAGFIVGRVGKVLKHISGEGQKQMSVMVSILEENLSALKIIKAFTAEEKMNSRFEKENETFTQINNALKRRHDLASPVSEFLGATIICIVFWYGGNLIFNDQNASLTPDLFITYIGLFYQLLAPSKNISQAYIKLQKGSASIDRILQVLDAEEEVDENGSFEPISGFNHSIEFKNVDFTYPNTTKKVLKNINFEIKKGQTIALVGQSGSGKSTLADLLARYYDIDSGQILIDGKDIKTIDIQSLRSLFGIISQESILFNDSVENNLTLGVDHYSQDQLYAAAQNANAMEFISKNDEGFSANVGERGGNISGGQRQRLSIARAILPQPQLLIMDEATSALDTESERLVQDALDKLLENSTSLVIAHRLSTIINADRILVLHEGELVESGSHQELLHKNRFYAKLHQMQNIT